jgi:hypothetical protein
MVYEYGEPRWNDIDRGNPKKSGENLVLVSLPTTNLTWTDPGTNSGIRSESQATIRLSYGMDAFLCFIRSPGAILTNRWIATFQRNVLPPSSAFRYRLITLGRSLLQPVLVSRLCPCCR